ncbi:hypothetical protein FACS1894190_18310 [Spirochaetia bacterium]|nr:hypothetical protein FACS1894190_18310 [Spirochaetia bacterium]
MDKIKSFKDKCIIIRIRTENIAIRGSIDKDVHRCWRMRLDRAKDCDYVLAVVDYSPEVKGVFKPDNWYCPDDEFCKGKEEECKRIANTNTALCKKIKKRIAFEGKEITNDVNYLHKEIPKQYFPGQNPFRYTY